MAVLLKQTACHKVPYLDEPACRVVYPNFAADLAVVEVTKSPGNVPTKTRQKQRRWLKMEGRGGKQYWHNTQTGEDRWERPSDFAAEDVPPPPLMPTDNSVRSLSCCFLPMHSLVLRRRSKTFCCTSRIDSKLRVEG